MNNVQLSTNFKLTEFVKQGVSDYSLALLKQLAKNLQLIRDKLQIYAIDSKKPVSIIVSSGVRTEQDYNRLVSKGYHPSKTSDHFCGYQLLSKPTLGAADISVTNCILTLQSIASLVINMNRDRELDVGQVIFEHNPKTGSSWLHIGNDWTKVFNTEFLEEYRVFDTRKKYLMSLDNGKTYQEFDLTKINKVLKEK